MWPRAPPELIAAVFSLDPHRVQIFTAARNGRDGIAGTVDDLPIQSLAVFGASLGIDADHMKILGGQIELGDPAAAD